MNPQVTEKPPATSESFAHGAEWLRADFHLHTKADNKFAYSGDVAFYNSAYVEALALAKIRVGVITNHNKFDYTEFKALRSTAKRRGIGLLPGVELSVREGAKGIHTLIIFSDEWLASGQDHINPFLTIAFEGKTPSEYEKENGRTSLSLLQTIKKLEGYHRDFFLIFAHVEQDNGLWAELDGGPISDLGTDEYFRQRTLGFQKVRTHDGAGSGKPCRTKIKEWLKDWYPAEVEGSDPANIEEIGRGNKCYLKLGELSFEAVKFALFDHEQRCRLSLPAIREAARLLSVSFAGAKLDGQEIPLSESLNCLIGPRGNGKSAIIECVRYALGFNLEGRADEEYKAGLVESMLTPGGKVVVKARDEFGRAIHVERERSGAPSVFVDEKYREIAPSSVLKDILYFGQKDLTVRSESFDEHFLDRLLADRLPSRKQEEQHLIEQVSQAAKQLRETLEATEKLSSYRKEMNELEVQLQVYTDKGVDTKLQNMTTFDSDRQAILSWQTQLTTLHHSLGEEQVEWSEIVSGFPTMRSDLVEPVASDLRKVRDQISEGAKQAASSAGKLATAISAVSNAMKKLEPVQKRLKDELGNLQRTLNEPSLDLELFRKKKARLEQLKKLLMSSAQRGKTEQVVRDLMGAAAQQLREFRRQTFQDRETEIRVLEGQLPQDIRIKTAFKGNAKSFGDYLRATMRGSGLQSTAYDTIAETFADGWDLYKRRAELDSLLTESAASKIRAALADHLAEFITFRVPDKTEILFQGVPLGKYSLGQRATVILHFLMHVHRHPILLIDQPEDDLDNETLYSHFVQQLLERKEETQFVFATHNANIPVLGDAEQVIVCRRQADSFTFEHGSIDAKDIQSRIITVMEGGEDAFRRRKEIYQLWKNSN